jgi:cyclophilin family peptidyl-prolyl cis-trans isomerase
VSLTNYVEFPPPALLLIAALRFIALISCLVIVFGAVGVFGAEGSNTVVRFHFATGEAAVGDVDVELFDADKPATVRNFLLYVRSGAYNEVLLNRLLPGILLQGGGFTNTVSKTNATPFLDFGPVQNFGMIPNEFAVGTLYSNVFGTLAMAKVGTNANSASAQWFFNLGDNSASFDTQSGGFTVFGRVLAATNQTDGTNLFATFNSLSQSNGIVDMTTFFGPTWSSFTDLPVTYTGYAVPQNRQVFYVTVSELNPPLADTNPPTISIASPVQDQVVTNANLVVTGNAVDNRNVARVLYFFGDATAKVATGTTNWTTSITLSLGTNIFSAQSVDDFGNVSALAQRRVIYELPGQALSNTVVRFHFETGEAPVGDVDVELFDTDKPQTVRNFLLYVRNGSYNRVIAHRLAPRFVLQSGGYTNFNPVTNDQPFSLFSEVLNLGMITNEFAVGRRMSNFFGTIAMAKLGNNANSASSEWFFNLANNSTNLDSQNGGFTVFGRVLASTNANSGTNLLAFFNSFSSSNGIVNMTNFFGPTWSAFTELPVNYSNTVVQPRNKDLFYITVSELYQTNIDTTPPVVTITNPAPDEIVTNTSVILSGTASDDQSVARVIYFFNDTAPRVATGTTNWSAVLTLRAGTNFVFVQSVDAFGNLSPLVERHFIQQTLATLTLDVKGDGTVSGLTNGQQLEIGALYTIHATPGRKSFFGGWSGTVSGSSNDLTFKVTTNTSLTATFKLYPFPKGQGRYKGLFIATNQPSRDSSGLFQTLIRANRRHSGSIQYRNGSYVFSGTADKTGQLALQGTLLGQNVSMTLRLDITDQPERLAGVAFIGGTVSALEAYRVERRARTNAMALPGNYTFLISGAANAVTAPGGQGFGTMKMTKAGKITMNGTLGDGTPFSEKAELLAQDRWVVSSPLYDKAGAIMGWSRFDTNETGSFSGNLSWFKPSEVADTYYPTGFTSTVTLRGAPFTVAPAGERVFNWTNGTVTIQGGNLQRSMIYRVQLNDDDTFTVLTGPTPLTLAIDRNTGQISGSFLHPVTQADTPLEGTIVRVLDEGGGLFFGPDQTGSFSIQEQ